MQTRADRFEDLRDWATGFPYLPIRPPTARRVLRALPIGNPSDYTFVDLGSGKGRMLLLAAEFPFRRIVGVEKRQDLHDQAMENVQRFRHRKIKCSQIDCRLVDATRYDFPTGKLVVYLFNPFGGQVMSAVLKRLDASFEQHPRDIVLAYVYPESGFLLNTMHHFQKCKETPLYWLSRSRFRAASS